MVNVNIGGMAGYILKTIPTYVKVFLPVTFVAASNVTDVFKANSKNVPDVKGTWKQKKDKNIVIQQDDYDPDEEEECCGNDHCTCKK